MLYIFLFIILLICAYFFYRLFDEDVLSVSFITSLVYALSSLAAFISYVINGSWNYINLHFNTFIYVFIGVAVVGVGEYLVRKKYKKIEKNNIKKINVASSKTLICSIFVLLTIILVYFNMKSITGGSSIGEIINKYKINSAMYKAEDVLKIRFVYTQMFRVSIVIGIAFLYFFINNLFVKDHKIKNYMYLVPVILSMMLSILLGGRSAILRFFIAGFVFYMILYRKNKKMEIKKFVIIGSICLVLMLPLFYFALAIIGQKSYNGFIDYITFYLGAPIPCLDAFLNGNVPNTVLHFGENTFIGIQHVLYRLGIIDYYNVYQNTWIYFKVGLSSNVFTGIKNYIQDFGIVGMVLFQTMFGVIFAYLYEKAKELNYKWIIFYGIISICIFDQFRAEKIFNNLFTIDTVIFVVALYLLIYFIFNYRETNVKNDGSKINVLLDYIVNFKFAALYKKIINNVKVRMYNAHGELNNDYHPVVKKSNHGKTKIAVYTCITGNYDKKIEEPLIKPNNIDYYLFTDNKEIKSENWIIKKIPSKLNKYDNILKNRYVKMHPFEYFKDYDYAIYIDGNVQILMDINDLTYCINKKIGIGMHKHQFRDCIYNEIEVCRILNKGNYEKMKSQVKRYETAGFPRHFGMLEATIIVSNLNNKKAQLLFNDWWDEFVKSESLRDQISLPYVIWKNKLNIDDLGILGNNLYKNPRFKVNIHK